VTIDVKERWESVETNIPRLNIENINNSVTSKIKKKVFKKEIEKTGIIFWKLKINNPIMSDIMNGSRKTI